MNILAHQQKCQYKNRYYVVYCKEFKFKINDITIQNVFYFLAHRSEIFQKYIILLNKTVLTFFRKVKNGPSCIGILLVYVVFTVWNTCFYFLFNNNCLEFKNKTLLSICWIQFQLLKQNCQTILNKEQQQLQKRCVNVKFLFVCIIVLA